MIALGLALTAALCWGVSDFLGGVQSRRLPVLGVLLTTQAVIVVACAFGVAAFGGGPPGGAAALDMFLAGFAYTVSVLAFFCALTLGPMSVVAPITGAGAVIPTVIGIAGGDRPSVPATAGIAAILVGVALAARVQPGDRTSVRAQRASVGLSLVAAGASGLYYVAMQRAASGSIGWTLLIGSSTAVLAFAAAALPRGAMRDLRRADLKPLCAVGLLNVAANASYALSTRDGDLSVVAVVGSMFPVVTVMLARFTLKERLHPIQAIGVSAALCGVCLTSV